MSRSFLCRKKINKSYYILKNITVNSYELFSLFGEGVVSSNYLCSSYSVELHSTTDSGHHAQKSIYFKGTVKSTNGFSASCDKLTAY